MKKPPRDRFARVRFEIKEHHGIWSVTKDNVFYGDFTLEADAETAADVGVTTILAQGGQAVKIYACS
jgi:hypothetical protein